MKKRIWRIVGLVVAFLLVLGVGGAAGGGIVYALTRTRGAASLIGASEPNTEPGVLIASVAQDGPADEAALGRGDILLELDGEPVDSVGELMEYLLERAPGDEVRLTVLHGDSRRTHTATLGDSDGKAYLGIIPCGRSAEIPGAVLRRGLPGSGALIIDVVTDSPADVAGLQEGDTIVAVADTRLDLETDLADAISEHDPGERVSLEVNSPDEETRDVTVELGEDSDNGGVAYLGVRYRRSPALHMRGLPFQGGRFGRWHLDGLPFGEPHLEGGLLRRLPEGGFDLKGAVIHRVTDGSPADEAGLRRGDIVTAIEGSPVEAPEDLGEAIDQHDPGDRITLTVSHPMDTDEERELDVTLGEHPEKEGVAYLGVTLGGFVRVQVSGDDGHSEEMELDLDLDFDLPFEHLPFQSDTLPHHFEFHFPPGSVDGDRVGCCSATGI